MPRPPALNPDGTRKHPPRERDVKRKRETAQQSAQPSAESVALLNAKPRPLPIDFTDDAPPFNPIADRMKRAKKNVEAINLDACEVAASLGCRASRASAALACASGSPDAPAMLEAQAQARRVRIGHVILTAQAAAAAFESGEPEAALTTLSGIQPLTSEAEAELARRLLPWRFAPVVDLL